MNNFKKLRKARGLSQAEVARRLNVARPTVVQWDNGKTAPHIRYLKSLASILECKVEDLLPNCV